MKDRIIEIIEEISNRTDLKNNPNIDLLDSDIIDSLTFIELISALEDEFDIEIQPTQIPADTWRNIESITNMVEDKIKNHS